MRQPLLTVNNTSSFLHVHPKTLYKWVKEGKVPHYKIHGQIRFKHAELVEFLDTGKERADIFECLSKFELSLEKYDKIFLKGRSNALSTRSRRWNYGFGGVYTRKTKDGKTRYYIDYRDRQGKRKREVVSHAQQRAHAVLVLQKKIKEALEDHIPCKKTASFPEFAELYLEKYSKSNKKSWQCDDYCLHAHLIPYFKKYSIAQITSFEIESYREKRLASGIKKSTSNRELALLKKMLNLAVDWGYLSENPALHVKLSPERDNQRDRVLSEAEEQRLLLESAEHLRPIITVALNTGMRKNEILTLTWDQVDMKQRLIRVVKTKSGKNRVIPINDPVFELFSDLAQKKASDYVFPNPDTGKPFRTVRHSFENACRRAKILNFRFHDLRHTFGSRLIQKGIDIVTVQNLLGHHSVTVTQRYTHTNIGQMQEAVFCLSSGGQSVKKDKNEVDLAHICHTEKASQKESVAISLFSVK